jgi:hypothetical protein
MSFWAAIIVGFLIYVLLKTSEDLAKTKNMLSDLIRSLYDRRIITSWDIDSTANISITEGIDEPILKRMISGWLQSSFKEGGNNKEFKRIKKLARAYFRAAEGKFRRLRKLNKEDKKLFFEMVKYIEANTAINSFYWGKIHNNFYPKEAEQKKIIENLKNLSSEEKEKLKKDIDNLGGI